MLGFIELFLCLALGFLFYKCAYSCLDGCRRRRDDVVADDTDGNNGVDAEIGLGNNDVDTRRGGGDVNPPVIIAPSSSCVPSPEDEGTRRALVERNLFRRRIHREESVWELSTLLALSRGVGMESGDGDARADRGGGGDGGGFGGEAMGYDEECGEVGGMSSPGRYHAPIPPPQALATSLPPPVAMADVDDGRGIPEVRARREDLVHDGGIVPDVVVFVGPRSTVDDSTPVDDYRDDASWSSTPVAVVVADSPVSTKKTKKTKTTTTTTAPRIPTSAMTTRQSRMIHRSSRDDGVSGDVPAVIEGTSSSLFVTGTTTRRIDDVAGDDCRVASTSTTTKTTKTTTKTTPRMTTGHNMECSICLDQFSPGDEIAWAKDGGDLPTSNNYHSAAVNDGAGEMMMGCDHIFHGRCLVAWLQHHDECPLCRRTLVHADADVRFAGWDMR
ncbi:hypothetical protein ACHAXA_005258 [Cyclostephanos tholiformis]|uniref:RING-type domain-containing protein n=1 Tax=Cyclostephanos tholiformis TaxID=382380 RepID=A0ABD3R4I7_9STRA